MKRKIRVVVGLGDIRRFGADVVAVMYAQGLHGASRAVAAALGKSEGDVRALLASQGGVQLFSGEGKIKAKQALFIDIPSPESPEQSIAHRFCHDVLKGLRSLAPGCRHLAMPLRVSAIMNSVVALRGQVAGCKEAISGGAFPRDLETITLVEHESRSSLIWDLQAALYEILPSQEIEAEVPEVPEAPVEEPAADASKHEKELDVFVSYKSEDIEHARKVYEFLKSQGIIVFFSKESLPRLGSDEYREQIDLAIERAKHMAVVTTSRENIMAKWVKYEWGLFLGEKLAGRKKGNLITIIAGDMAIDELPISLRNREVIRLVPGEFEKLLDYVKRVREVGTWDSDMIPNRAQIPHPGFTDPVQLHRIQDFVVSKTERLKNTSWNDAVEYIKPFSAAGEGGWQLPSIEQLKEIQKASIFPDRWCYWSSREVAGQEAYYLHFDDGHIGRGPKSFSKGLCAVFVRKMS